MSQAAMEEFLLEESFGDNMANTSTLDQTSSESTSFETSGEDGGPDRRAPLRTSRRRIQKNTAVVLNADRLKRFAEEESNSSILPDGPIARIPPAEQPISPHSGLEDTQRQAAHHIASWWRQVTPRHALQSSRRAFTPTPPQELFALVLGYRVRKIMASTEIKHIVAEHKDVKLFFADLVRTHLPPSDASTASSVPRSADYIVEKWIRSRKASSISAAQVLTGIDHNLAASLAKQMLAEREKLHAAVFRNALWADWPLPGYWKLDVRNRIKKAKVPFVSPPRAVQQQKVGETPPHVKAAMHAAVKVPVKLFVNKNNSRLIEEDAPMPKPLKEVMDKVAREDRPIRGAVDASRGNDRPLSSPGFGTPFQSVSSSHIAKARPADSSSVFKASSSARKASPAASASAATSSTRKRSQEGGHVQLDIISGDRLMPAKKGAVGKDAQPDRKPCLKVSMYLPAAGAGAGAAGQKKVFHTAHDFSKVTLQPTWDSTTVIPLPFLKSCLKGAEDMDEQDELSQEDYEKIVKHMLEIWCSGSIVVEVVDGERFNEDIFMGQAKILMPSFMPSVRKMDELEVKGNFQLEKAKPSDRVSGSIRLHAYLHVPEKGYIEDQIAQMRVAGAAEASKRRSLAAVKKPTREAATPSPPSPPFEDVDVHHRTPVNGSSALSDLSTQFSSSFMKAIAGIDLNVDLMADGDGMDDCPDPRLEESENINLDMHGMGHHRSSSAPVGHVDKSKMAKLKAGLGTAASRVSSSSKATPIKTSTPEHVSSSSSRRHSSGVSVSSIVSKETAMESSMVKRNFISDMAKQLDDLSAIQFSADAVMNNFNQKLAKQRQHEDDHDVLLSYKKKDDNSSARGSVSAGRLRSPPPQPVPIPLPVVKPQPLAVPSEPPAVLRTPASKAVVKEVDEDLRTRTPLAQDLEDSDLPMMADMDREREQEESDCYHSDSEDYLDAVDELAHDGYHSEDYDDDWPPHGNQLDDVDEVEEEEEDEDEVYIIPSPVPVVPVSRSSPLHSSSDEGMDGWKPPPPPPRTDSRPPPVPRHEEERTYGSPLRPTYADDEQKEEQGPSPRWKKRPLHKASLELAEDL